MHALTAMFAIAIVCVGPPTAGDVDVPGRTQLVVGGLAFPTAAAFAPGDSTHLYILEKPGRVRVFDLATNTLLPEHFLDIDPLVIGGATVGSEQGLLGIEFDPAYQTNGYFYVSFTGITGSGDQFVQRYTALSPTLADAGSAHTIITWDDPFVNHNGGWIGFGPDGYLYIATGDGGSANDPNNHAQDVTNQKLGKMLRLDTSADDFPANPNANYAIPQGNPFVDLPGDDEIWFWGLRDPWRCSFDRLTGDLWIGDVGQTAFEEIDFAPAGVGGLNFGWRCMEGPVCTGLTGCTCSSPSLTSPIWAYDHGPSGLTSVTGGYVYRGCAIAEASGLYFFADWGSAKFWSFRQVDGVATEFAERTSAFTPSIEGIAVNTVVSWAEDHNGELYLVDHGNALAQGQIFRVIRDPSADPAPPRTGDLDGNGFVDGADLGLLLSGWGGPGVGDLNDDGVIDGADLGVLLGAWGACPAAS